MSTYKELVRIAYRTNEWFLTSSNEMESYGGETYVPAPLGVGKLDYSSKVPKSNLDISLDLQHAISQALLIPYLDGAVSATVFTQVDGITEQAFKGVLSSRQPNPEKLVMRFESTFTAMRDPGLRRRFGRLCPHTLYGRGCNLDPENFADLAVVTALNSTGFVVTVPEAANRTDGYYLAGMLRGPDGILRYVSSHVGDQINLLGSLPSLTGVTSSYTASTISAAAADNSINDSANGLPIYAVGEHAPVSGFLDVNAELNAVHVVVSSTASKLVVATDITADEAAGESVTLTTGDSIKLYPGCDKARLTCLIIFNDNLDNNGGQYWIPKKNPLGGSSIA